MHALIVLLARRKVNMEGTRMFIYLFFGGNHLETCTHKLLLLPLTMYPIGYSERRKFFQESLRRLKEGALNFDVFKSICHSEQVKYPEPVILSNIPVLQLETHEYSTKIQPNEIRDRTPIESKGSGNCLFRYVVTQIYMLLFIAKVYFK